jgi:predicted secreted protein
VAVWSALFLREPAHPQIDAWRERVWALLHQTGADPNLRLRAAMLMAKEGWYNGHHAELTQLPALVHEALGQPAVTPYGRLLWGLMRQYAAWAAADWAGGLQATEDALADGQSSGIALLDQHLRLHGACFASLTGDDAQADRWLAAVADRADPARRMEAWHHFSVRGWLALRRGQWAQADAAARIAVEAAQAMGPAPLAMALAVSAHARAALADGASLQPTRDALAAVVAVSPRNALARLHLGLLDARMAQTLGDVDAALRALRQTLPLVRAHGLEAPFGIDPEALSSLLLLALNHGVEPSAATALASAMRLRAPAGAGAVWPYPVRVRTNNHVEIELQGRPLRPVGKAQRRPIELLQALIEQGGQATATTLADRLWPDADGDQAMASFEVALRRLRQLVSCPAALVLSGGVLALDRRLVWVDVLDAPVGIPHSSAIRRPSVGRLELGAS